MALGGTINKNNTDFIEEAEGLDKIEQLQVFWQHQNIDIHEKAVKILRHTMMMMKKMKQKLKRISLLFPKKSSVRSMDDAKRNLKQRQGIEEKEKRERT